MNSLRDLLESRSCDKIAPVGPIIAEDGGSCPGRLSSLLPHLTAE